MKTQTGLKIGLFSKNVALKKRFYECVLFYCSTGI